jgi:hypothetical protein
MERWRCLKDKLIEAGVRDADVIEAVRRVTAPGRIEARIQTARAVSRRWIAAQAELAEGAEPSEEILDLRARALCWLEAELAELRPIPTRRLPPFQLVGSGRRHAADGAAWTEAIRDASRFPDGAEWRLSSKDGEVALEPQLAQPQDVRLPLEPLLIGLSADEFRQVLGLLDVRGLATPDVMVALAAAVQRGIDLWAVPRVEDEDQ